MIFFAAVDLHGIQAAPCLVYNHWGSLVCEMNNLKQLGTEP